MNNHINLAAIYIANLMAVMVLATTLISNTWRFRYKGVERRYLSMLVVTTFIGCILDPIIFSVEGHVGGFYRMINFGGNTLLFALNLILGPAWMFFLSSCLGIRLSKIHRFCIIGLNAIGAVLLLLNFFNPIVFCVTADNVYCRGFHYMYYLIVEGAIILDSVILYFWVRKKSGFLKFFPVWIFMIPVACGIAIQTFIYGVSTVWPFIAVAISAVLTSLQNEQLFEDKLTGLYNRFYLDDLKNRISSDNQYTAMLLDLNQFKSINDRFGHQEGDDALIETAQRVRMAVGAYGEVIRYAGDEFIVILNTRQDDEINGISKGIQDSLDHYNKTSRKPYELSVSIGICRMNLDQASIDEVLDEADKQMYLNKKAYYEKNPREDRRRS
ncbi:MAG: GGDEF domain-containing protein [Lachnospiraceae bacterium]|nr:GGDEF domain-containing protein [Candidatus Equihabitans merdae]